MILKYHLINNQWPLLQIQVGAINFLSSSRTKLRTHSLSFGQLLGEVERGGKDKLSVQMWTKLCESYSFSFLLYERVVQSLALVLELKVHVFPTFPVFSSGAGKDLWETPLV